MKQKSKSLKLKVAITGNIGSGKTTFSRFVHDFGYKVFYSDDIAKDLLAKDPRVKSEIIESFGAQSYQGKEVNTKYLSDMIFSDPIKLKKINSILHPRVFKKLEEIFNQSLKSRDIIFVEAALIYEAKFEKMFDFIVLITANQDVRMKRYISNKQSSKDDFIKREKNQGSQEIKQQKADFVFSNNGSTAELKSKASLLIKVLEAYLN